MSIRIMSWVFEHSTVEHRGDLLVLLVLADHASDDGSAAYPNIDTLGRKARLSRRGVIYALERLKAGGHIEPQGRGPKRGPTGQSPVAYRIVMSERGAPTAPLRSATTAPLSAEGVQSLHERGAVSDRKGCRGLHPNRPEPSMNLPARARARAVDNSPDGEDQRPAQWRRLKAEFDDRRMPAAGGDTS